MKIELTPEDVSGYLRWEITDKGARIIGCDEKFEGSMEIPSRLDGAAVVEIGKEAFSERHSLKSVAIPGSVEVVGEDAFKGCDGLNELRLGRGIKKIEGSAFWGCSSLKSVEVPDSVEVVGEEAFRWCDGLEELHLGAGIKTIEKHAFKDCSSLRRVVLPSTLEALARDAFDESVDLVVDDERHQDSAFGGSDSLKSDANPKTTDDASQYLRWEITERGARIIGCDEKFEGAMEIPSRLGGAPVVEIGKEAFSRRDSLKSVAIPDSVEVVGEKAFAHCSRLQGLHLGAGIKKIESSAFFGCNTHFRCNSMSVFIPSSVEFVGEYAFAYCGKLNKLRLGRGIKKIENGTFCGCGSLKSVEVPDSVEVVGECAFAFCGGLQELHLGAGIKKIERDAFRGCSSLKSVEVPDSVEVVKGAFSSCDGREELRFRIQSKSSARVPSPPVRTRRTSVGRGD